MKKVFAFALVVALVMSLAVPVSADVGSVAGSVEDLKPFVVESTCDDAGVYSAEEIEELPEEVQKVFVEAKEKLSEAVPAGMLVRYFIYLDICEDCGEATVELRVDDYSELVIKLFINGEWIEVEFVVNEDGTITVVDVIDAPAAIMVK